MNNQLYQVFYRDQFEKECQRLLISNEQNLERDVKKIVNEENPDQHPTVISYPWISGYYIQPMSDKLENIVKELKDKAIETYPDIEGRIGYLEALRDVLTKVNEKWEEQDQKISSITFRKITATLGDSSNIPAGYDDEGNRW